MNVARVAEPDGTPQDRCPCQAHFAGLQDNRLVQRTMLIFIVLTKEYSQKNGIAWNLHVTPTSSH